MSKPRPIRVLLAKTGLDGHTRGIRVVARALQDAGMEVIYTGIRQTPAQVVAAAIQEDVEAVGLSSLSGAHLPLFKKVAEGIRTKGLDGVLLFCGGIIPEEDRAELAQAGFDGIFAPGTSTAEIVEFVKERVAARRKA